MSVINKDPRLEEVKKQGKPEDFSYLSLYGFRGFFLKKQSEGFTEYAFGGGPWTGSYPNEIRVVGMFACFSPDGKVTTLQTLKAYTEDFHTCRATREQNFTKEQFESFVKKYEITLGPNKSIQELLSLWTQPDGSEN